LLWGLLEPGGKAYERSMKTWFGWSIGESGSNMLILFDINQVTKQCCLPSCFC
jgi:hypothetical protein